MGGENEHLGNGGRVGEFFRVSASRSFVSALLSHGQLHCDCLMENMNSNQNRKKTDKRNGEVSNEKDTKTIEGL